MHTTSLDLTDMWICPHCGLENIPERQSCKRCQQHKQPLTFVTADPPHLYPAKPIAGATKLLGWMYWMPFLLLFGFLARYNPFFWLLIAIVVAVLIYSLTRTTQQTRSISLSPHYIEYRYDGLTIRTTWHNIKTINTRLAGHVTLVLRQPSGIGFYPEGRNNRPLRSEIALYLGDYINGAELARDIEKFYPSPSHETMS
jgi:hypothetical protein